MHVKPVTSAQTHSLWRGITHTHTHTQEHIIILEVRCHSIKKSPACWNDQFVCRASSSVQTRVLILGWVSRVCDEPCCQETKAAWPLTSDTCRRSLRPSSAFQLYSRHKWEQIKSSRGELNWAAAGKRFIFRAQRGPGTTALFTHIIASVCVCVLFYRGADSALWRFWRNQFELLCVPQSALPVLQPACTDVSGSCSLWLKWICSDLGFFFFLSGGSWKTSSGGAFSRHVQLGVETLQMVMVVGLWKAETSGWVMNLWATLPRSGLGNIFLHRAALT